MINLLFIDGMGAPKIGWNSLVMPAVDRYDGKFFAKYCEWQNWQSVGLKSNINWHIIIGHSLGGDSAIRLCRYLGPKLQPQLLMTLGARHQSAASWLDWLIPLGIQGFEAPNDVTHNFYTYGLLPSQPMKGAQQNTNVTSVIPPIWHGNIPSAPAVQACLDYFLKGLLNIKQGE